MNDALQIGQFAIVAHEPQERGATIGVAEGNGTGVERCELFALAEGTTPAAHEYAGHLVSQAERTWKTLNLSLTGALIAIYGEAQRSLMDWNTRSVSQHRVGLGLACLARQGERIVLASRGPASILHASGDTLTLHEPDDEHAEPMNGLEPGQPQLTSLTLAPGDRVLLVTTNVTESLSEDALADILSRSLPEVLPNLYRRITHLRDAAVLLVGVPEAGEEILPPPAPPAKSEPEDEGPIIGGEAPAGGSPRDFQPSLFVESSPRASALDVARRRLEDVDARSRVDAELPQATPLAEAQELPPLRRAAGDGGPIPQPPSAAPGAGEGHSFFRQVAHVRQPPAPPVASHHTGAAPVSQLAADRRMQLSAMTNVPTSGSLAAGPRTGSAVVRARRSMGGGMRTGGRTETAGGGFSPPAWLAGLVAILLLTGIVSWAVLPGLLESDEATRLSQLIDEAEREIATANAVDQPDQRRAALTRARGILLEATALAGGASLAEPLLRQADRELAALDAIATPMQIRTFADLRGFGEAPIAARQLVVSASHAYLLDSAGGQVISITLSTGKKATVFAAGEETPLAPVAITYADVSRPGGSALLIVDEGGGLWTWSTAGWVAEIEFARPAGLTVTDMYFAEGRLFVLDAPNATVYSFAAGPSGFGLDPVVMHQGPELENARRIMVDGGVLLTTAADGSIRRYSGELTLLLAQAGIDTPLTGAATPHTSGFANEIAILDASADRIVVLAADGTFARQYRHAELENLTAFTMRGGFGWVISGEQLRRITF
ncbi:MAG: hypothetical protein OXS47_06300 [Chloroflexota bacterium]|nr:hypothetical protein [Chloroflexota bacterium]